MSEEQVPGRPVMCPVCGAIPEVHDEIRVEEFGGAGELERFGLGTDADDDARRGVICCTQCETLIVPVADWDDECAVFTSETGWPGGVFEIWSDKQGGPIDLFLTPGDAKEIVRQYLEFNPDNESRIIVSINSEIRFRRWETPE